MRFFKAQNSSLFATSYMMLVFWQAMLNKMMITLAKLFSSLFFPFFYPCTRTYTFSASDKHTYSVIVARSTPEGYSTGRCGQIELNVPVHKLVVALCAENRWKKGSRDFGACFPTRRSRCLRYKYRDNSISSGGVCG